MSLNIRDNIRTLWFGVYCHVSLWHLSYRRSSSGCKYFVIPLDIVKFIFTVSSVGVSLQRIVEGQERQDRIYLTSLFFFYVVYLFFSEGKLRSLMAFWHSENVSHFFFSSCVSVTISTRLWNMNWSISALTLKLRAISIINSKINIFIFISLNKQSQVKFDSVANGEIPQYNQFKLHKQRDPNIHDFSFTFFASTRLKFIYFFPVLNVKSFFFLFSFIVSAQVFDQNQLDYIIKIVRIILSFAHVFFINHISLLHSFKKITSGCRLS